jgi:hypothetical protein
MSFCKSCSSSGEERNFEVASRWGYLFKSFVTLSLFQALKGYKKEWGGVVVFWLLPADRGVQRTCRDSLESAGRAWS